MRERVEGLLDIDCRAMWISTFHALCARLLRREAPHIGLSRDFTIYDSADQQSVIKQLIKEYNLDDATYQPRMVLGRISHAKNRMEGPDSFENTWNPRDREIGRLFAGYIKALTEASALDFDDLLLKSVELFERSPAVARSLCAALQVRDGGRVPGHQPAAVPAGQAARRRSTATWPSSAIPISPSTSGAARTCATSWTSRQDFPEAVVVRLEQNYRSTQVILDAASAVIAQQPQPQGEGALDRPEGRRQDHLLPRRPTSSRRPSSSRGSRAPPSRTTSMRRWRCSTAPTRSRARWKTRCGRRASPT